jgi:hypothetical protein
MAVSTAAAGSSAAGVGLSPSANTKLLLNRAVNMAVHIAQPAIAGVFFMRFLLESCLSLLSSKTSSSSADKSSLKQNRLA